jgi:hypothetical protein
MRPSCMTSSVARKSSRDGRQQFDASAAEKQQIDAVGHEESQWSGQLLGRAATPECQST